MAPQPRVTYNYLYLLNENSSNNYTVANLPSQGTAEAYDDPQGQSDDQSILGDIDPDSFKIIIDDSDPSDAGYFAYIGRASRGDGFIAQLANGNYYLVTNTQPTSGTYSATNEPTIICYLSGTLIRTTTGDVAVEALMIGDHAVTASGKACPIRWIGHRTMRCGKRKDVLPVRIAAHAFGESRPARDLFVSPAHAIAVDVLGEVLIPACRLINGTTITQVDMETVT